MASQTRLKPQGLAWLAQRNPDQWVKPNGKPYIARIANDAKVGRSSLHEMLRGHRLPGRATQDRIRDLAVSTGVSHDRANSELFEIVEINDAQAVA